MIYQKELYFRILLALSVPSQPTCNNKFTTMLTTMETPEQCVKFVQI